ncbi:AGAP004353-PA-like protein [Anopheles sinensis]|uniref:AGAP004353-PA-like protein n=1 Tax=Anopheles sinensis TaxID=74873 RepID=A0A084WQ75_ANOSI|nr:AGAP004353-PA-like protein [Anopheles sinensis]
MCVVIVVQFGSPVYLYPHAIRINCSSSRDCPSDEDDQQRAVVVAATSVTSQGSAGRSKPAKTSSKMRMKHKSPCLMLRFMPTDKHGKYYCHPQFSGGTTLQDFNDPYSKAE